MEETNKKQKIENEVTMGEEQVKTYHKMQLVCVSRLKRLADTLDKDSSDYKAAFKVIQATKNRRPALEEDIGELKVVYYEQPIGPQRRYANPYVELFSLSKTSGLRGAASHGLYVDFDLEGAYQVILQALCQKHCIDCLELDEHLGNRENQLAELGALINGDKYTKRKAAKEYFNAVYNGAGDNFEQKWKTEWGASNSNFETVARVCAALQRRNEGDNTVAVKKIPKDS